MEKSNVEVELPDQMASLDIMEVENPVVVAASELTDPPLRVLRKRKTLSAIDSTKPTNRRVSMKPRKRVMSENANPKQIEALYLNKKVNCTSQTLETIYEENKEQSCEPKTIIGGRKVKRLLTFQLGSQYTKEKIKKRRAKIKKMLGNKSFLNRKKIPMHIFLKTIECLDLDDTLQPNINTTVVP